MTCASPNCPFRADLRIRASQNGPADGAELRGGGSSGSTGPLNSSHVRMCTGRPVKYQELEEDGNEFCRLDFSTLAQKIPRLVQDHGRSSKTSQVKDAGPAWAEHSKKLCLARRPRVRLLGFQISSHHDRHHRKMTDIIRLSEHDAQLQENTTLMGADIIASLITQDAGVPFPLPKFARP